MRSALRTERIFFAAAILSLMISVTIFMRETHWNMLSLVPLAITTLLLVPVGRRLSLTLADLQRTNQELLQRQAELESLNEALEESRERFRIAFANAPIGMALVGADGRVLEVNPALAQLLGYSADAVQGMEIADFTYPDDLRADLDQLQEMVAGDLHRYEMEKRFVHRSGRIIYGLMSASAVRDGRGQMRYVIGQVLDITERKRMELELQERADRDFLTGLHNRRRFMEDLDWAIALWKRYGTSGALMMIDLDGFKQVNDRLGHQAGDELLKRVATTLMSELRSADLYGRLGGDEFVCFLPAVGADQAMDAASRLLSAISAATRSVDGIVVTGSAGIAMLPEHGYTSVELLHHADLAMYQAKALGKNQAFLYHPQILTS